MDIHLEHHSDGSISTTAFRKATQTNKYLDFASHHPLAHKAAVVRTLQCRANAISSTVEAYEREEGHVIDVLLRNRYPKSFVVEKRGNQLSQSNGLTEDPKQLFASHMFVVFLSN